MKSKNPRYILRNWMLQKAVDEYENGNKKWLELMEKIISNPFEFN